MGIFIVYEDSNFLAINKPSGLLTHPVNSKDASPSVAGWLLKKYPQIKNVGENPLRPGLVHRLDKETSGLLIVAKNQPSFTYFKELFEQRKIKKTYLALVHGQVKNRSGTIDLPLGKIGIKQTTQLKGRRELKERPALTKYEVIKRFLFNALPLTLLSVSPLSGRTHQIRAHLKAIGHPVVGDRVYGSKKQAGLIKLGRLFLHAQKLEFTAFHGGKMVLEVDPPPELTGLLNSLTIVA